MTRITALLGVLVVHIMSGCVLGPQPEPPDVTESPAADVHDAQNGRFYDEGSDEAVEAGDYDDDGCPCDPGLAGGEWNCDDDRGGHEPPYESDDGFSGTPSERQALLPDPRTRFFGDDDDPEPIDTTHFGEDDPGDDDDDADNDDDDDGSGVIDD
jgi:hypothetical protein